MRILHTADWHVGKTLRGRSRLAEVEAVLAELVAIATEQACRLVLVTGDLFDAASPPPDAERVVYQGLLRLAGEGRTVVVVAGNHDSAARLAAIGPLAAASGIVVSATVAAPADGGVAEVEIDGETARIALLPWLSQRYVVNAQQLLSTTAPEQQQSYDARIRQIVAVLTAGFGAGTINLLAGHLHTTGGLLGGGERQAHTILDYAVSPLAFPASCSYVALGHLHRSQRVDGPCPIWYSGSPLQLDFGEQRDRKVALVVDVSPGRAAKVTPVRLGAGRTLRTVRGTLADLAAMDATADEWVQVIVEEPPRAGLADDVRQLFPDAVEVRLAPVETAADSADMPSRLGRSPLEQWSDYLASRKMADPRLEALFAELLEEAQQEEAQQEESLGAP
jgi:exonuclease SbcD